MKSQPPAVTHSLIGFVEVRGVFPFSQNLAHVFTSPPSVPSLHSLLSLAQPSYFPQSRRLLIINMDVNGSLGSTILKA